jgi:prepilin-type N-terminal cleavage/methylation domain-containing protein
MSRRLMMISRYQRGFTLYEMLVALAILGVIIPVIGMSIFQVLSINTLTGNHLTAVKQVENAIYRINRDAQMAQTVQTGGGSGFPLNLIWVEWDNTSNNVTYTIQNGELWRANSVNGGQSTSGVVAQHINSDSGMTNLQFVGGVLTVKITASLGGFRPASETRVGTVLPKAQ